MFFSRPGDSIAVMSDVPIHGLKGPVVLVATAAAAAPIHGLKEPVFWLKEPVVLVATAAAAAAVAVSGAPCR